MAKTARLDTTVVERGLLPSKQAAQAAIMDGGVIVNGVKVTKPGTPIKIDAIIELTAAWQGSKYVSRGGYKLERALQEFGIDPTGKICLDLGASTGGFTDCLLKHGAARVYAIDVGHGQLVGSLRQDQRVVTKERVNARHLKPEDLYGPEDSHASLAVADLSFISFTKVLPVFADLLTRDGQIVALIKPQFEAGKHAVGKGGVVRSKEIHIEVLKNTVDEAARLGFGIANITYSPIKGPAGNIEFLAHWFLNASPVTLDLKGVVEEAHQQLNTEKKDTDETRETK